MAKPLQLFAAGFHGSSFAVDAEDRLNCVYEIKKDPDGTRVVVRGTPGSKRTFTLPAFPIRGMRAVGSILYVVAASSLYSVTTAGVVAFRGALSSSSGQVSMSDCATQLAIVDGTAGYIFTIATNTFTTITDSNFPAGATTVGFLSGRFIVEKPGTREFYCSLALDGLTWTQFSVAIFGTKEQYSDLLRAVDGFNGVLVLWGAESIEYWQDAGTSPLPFQKVTGGTQTIGLYAKWSRALSDNAFYFLGSGLNSGLSIYAVRSYEPQKISTPDVEDFLGTLVQSYDLSDAVAMIYSFDGHDMYQLTFPAANVTIVYDSSSGLWSRAQTGVRPGRHFANVATKFNKQMMFADSTTGNIYAVAPLAYDDAGAVIVRRVTSRRLRHSGETFSLPVLILLMDTGQVPQGVDYGLTLEVSRDGGRTFGSPRRRSLGLVGQYKSPAVKWTGLGAAKDFVLRFTMTDPIPFIIAGVEADASKAK